MGYLPRNRNLSINTPACLFVILSRTSMRLCESDMIYLYVPWEIKRALPLKVSRLECRVLCGRIEILSVRSLKITRCCVIPTDAGFSLMSHSHLCFPSLASCVIATVHLSAGAAVLVTLIGEFDRKQLPPSLPPSGDARP